jgi:hypothetical protein
MQLVRSLLLAGALAATGQNVHSNEFGTAPSVTTVASEHACDEPEQVLVHGTSLRDVELACRGALRAVQFLGQAGLERPEWIRIQIAASMPGEMEGKAVGCYLRNERRVVLLSYESFERIGEWFRVPVHPELFVAAATHEVAHAMASCNFDPKKLPLGAHEYVAYVAMFATMDSGLRNQIASRFPGTGLKNAQEINTFGYLVDPPQFAVDSWRHYLRKKEKTKWIRSLASGEILQEDPSNDGP